jgi:large subunit ribosomal protein L18
MKKVNLANKRLRTKKRVRSKINGSKERPRISVFRSNKNIYIQAIDDQEKKTILTFSSLHLKKDKKQAKVKKTETAKLVGLKAAELLKAKGIAKVVFDRNYYLYHGRVKAVADGLREGGIIL